MYTVIISLIAEWMQDGVGWAVFTALIVYQISID